MTKERFQGSRVPTLTAPQVRVRPGSAFPLDDSYPAQMPDPEAVGAKKFAIQPGTESPPSAGADFTPEKLIGVRILPISLAAATTEATFLFKKIVGNVLWIPYSTNSTDLIFIKPNDASDFIPATRGWFLAGAQFNEVKWYVPTAVGGATLYLAYTFDPTEDKVRIQ